VKNWKILPIVKDGATRQAAWCIEKAFTRDSAIRKVISRLHHRAETPETLWSSRRVSFVMKARCFRRIVLSIAVFLACGSPFAPSQADEISQVRAAIVLKGADWQAVETSMTRLSPDERKTRLGLIIPARFLTGAEVPLSVPPPVAAPASLDWRSYNGENFVTPIRDQSSCGSCWAFASTTALESATLITNDTPGVNLDLSEQVLVSCADAGDCGGGSHNESSDYIRDVGLPLESCYPYTATNGDCADACSTYRTATYRIAGWSWVATTAPTVALLRDALYTNGPLITTMVVYTDFFSYGGGVYAYAWGVLEGGHAVLIVGYSDAGQYFIAKNSWGTGWGESGYFRIAYSQLDNSVHFGDWTIAYSSCSISPSSRSLGSSSGSGSISVTCGESCSWTAVSNNAWITITAGTSGTGNGTVSYSVSQNTGTKQRTGTITVAGRTFTITQEGTAPVIISRSPGSGTIGVAVDSTVSAAFNESMNSSSISVSSFTLSKGGEAVEGGVSYNNGSYRATFTPSVNLDYGTVYTVTVSTDVEDDEGVNLSSSSTWSFTTASSSSVRSGSGGGGGGGGCFIATAAFGSPFEPHVQILRDFRDRYLRGHEAGNLLVKLYEDLSPPVARIISDHEILKGIVRLSLLPLIGFAFVALHPGGGLFMAAGFFGVVSLAVGRKRRRGLRGTAIHDG
jgi:C1A family cysteine protease